MTNLVECPNCFGTGEEMVTDGTHARTCRTCDGKGYVTKEEEVKYLARLRIIDDATDQEDLH